MMSKYIYLRTLLCCVLFFHYDRQRLIFTGTGFPGKDGADWMMHWVGKLSENGMQNAYFRISKKERRVHHFVVKKMATANEPITAELDSELNITGMTEGADPMYSMALINTNKMKEISIVDIF